MDEFGAEIVSHLPEGDKGWRREEVGEAKLMNRNLTEASQKTRRPYVQSRFDLLIPQSVQGHRATPEEGRKFMELRIIRQNARIIDIPRQCCRLWRY